MTDEPKIDDCKPTPHELIYYNNADVIDNMRCPMCRERPKVVVNKWLDGKPTLTRWHMSCDGIDHHVEVIGQNIEEAMGLWIKLSDADVNIVGALKEEKQAKSRLKGLAINISFPNKR